LTCSFVFVFGLAAARSVAAGLINVMWVREEGVNSR
jgi:hypothetical protein